MTTHRNPSTKEYARRASARRQRLVEAIASLQHKIDEGKLSAAVDHVAIAASHQAALDAELEAAGLSRTAQDSAAHRRLEHEIDRLKMAISRSSPYRNPGLDALVHRLQP